MKKVMSAKELVLVSLMTAVTVVMAQISIPLPFNMMPFTCSMIAVYMTGMLLSPKHAVLTQLCYLMLGACGVPVFAGFRGGLPALFGNTGGYLLMYPIMAGLVAFAINGRKSREAEKLARSEGNAALKMYKRTLFVKAAAAICVAHTILYLGGTTWLSMIAGMPYPAALAYAVYPFIPLDIVKIVFCVTVILPLRSRLLSMNLLVLERAL